MLLLRCSSLNLVLHLRTHAQVLFLFNHIAIVRASWVKDDIAIALGLRLILTAYLPLRNRFITLWDGVVVLCWRNSPCGTTLTLGVNRWWSTTDAIVVKTCDYGLEGLIDALGRTTIVL